MKSKIRRPFLRALIVLAFSCSQCGRSAEAPQGEREIKAARIKTVSLVSLVATPLQYSGQVVRVCGVFVYDASEGNFLFLTKDHHRAWDIASSIMLSKAESTMKLDQSWSGYFVSVEGLFLYDSNHNRGIMKRIVGFEPVEAKVSPDKRNTSERGDPK